MTPSMLQPCAWPGKHQLAGRSGACRVVAPSVAGPLPGIPVTFRDAAPSLLYLTGEQDMLAVATAAQGQDHTQILIILAAIVLAIFWRAAIKLGLALAVVAFIVLLVKGDLALVHGLRLLVP